MSIFVLDPTKSEDTVSGFTTAPRLKTLDGKILGVITNGKRRADTVLQYVIDNLKEDYRLSEVKWVKKPSVSHPIPPDLIAELEGCHFVLSGIGD